MTARQFVHFNNAGAGLMPQAVTDAMTECVRREAAHGSYETELHYDKILQEGVYQRLATLLGAPARDIALFDSATRAWCSVAGRLRLGATDRVWVTPFEYAGNLISLFELRDRTGCRIEVVPLRPDGELDLDWMSANISDDVALVSVTHVPSGCGIVNPVAEIGRILAPYRCVYALDACQSVGQLRVDVAEIGCQLLTGAGRKFLRGPRGTGFAYVAPELRASLTSDFHDLHVARVSSPTGYTVEDDSARALELAERTTAAVLGLHAALGHHESAPVAEQQPVAEALRATLAELPGVELIAPGSTQSGITAFRHRTLSAQDIFHGLGTRGINVWQIRGDHTPLYLTERGVDQAVRASVHYYNTVDEVAVVGRALRDLIGS
ncbi:aminotransferase class V-fold PLP-dependent enzyme [Streptomyces sp. NPDC048506]|uniref:aminotransferase class V-fold PLP-dependent enzyme n=1 Tax=Streptomyces sp. NPDC048506 TaxID=3155028 RepID=UPI00342FD4F5